MQGHLPVALALAVTALAGSAWAQEGGDAELAKQLANPASSLISVPFQNNYDCCFGPEDGGRYTLNIQPVVPFRLTDDWNVIVRTILPVIWQEETVAGQGDSSGFGDITQTFFFTPSKNRNGLIWAVGPALLYPLGNDELGTEKWAAGPSLLVLKQGPTKGGSHTYGMLANHLWSYAGEDSREAVSTTFLQPFYSFTFPSTTGFSLNAEASYDWKHDQWTVPVNAGVSHIYKFGGQRVSMGVNARYYLERPDEGPEWGLRFTATLLFPGH